MKRTKLFIIIVMIVMMLFCFANKTLAVSNPADNATKNTATTASTSTITVKTGNANDTLSAYKIVNITINSNNELQYEFTDLFKSYRNDITIETYTDGKTYTSESTALKELLGGFASYVKTNNSKATDTAETDTAGVATFTDVGLGQYVIVGSGNTQGALVYQTVSAEITPFVENNEYKIYDSYNVTMKTTEPTFDKKITKGTVADVENTRHSASIGDTVTYQLEASVPTYPEGAKNTTFYMADTLSDGLKVPTSVKVMGYVENSSTGDTLTNGVKTSINGQQIYVDLNYDDIKGYSKIIVSYDVEVDTDAIIGTLGNVNNAKLIYSNEPFTGTTSENHPEGNGYGTKEDEEYVYTYGITIDKYEKNNSTQKLEGAEFEIYSDKECTNKVSKVTTNAEGYAEITGIKAGTYYLKETKAPAGYKIKADPIQVIVNKDAQTLDKVTPGHVNVEIDNIKGGTLPSTGGMGTVIFTVVGICLAGGAAILLITKKRIKNMN